jgi:hypothetical protein
LKIDSCAQAGAGIVAEEAQGHVAALAQKTAHPFGFMAVVDIWLVVFFAADRALFAASFEHLIVLLIRDSVEKRQVLAAPCRSRNRPTFFAGPPSTMDGIFAWRAGELFQRLIFSAAGADFCRNGGWHVKPQSFQNFHYILGQKIQVIEIASF